MNRTPPNPHGRLIRLSAAALTLALAGPALADDFDTESFSLRLSSSLFRLSTYPDVAAKTGAASAGVDNTSFNPVALRWCDLAPRDNLHRCYLEEARLGLSAQALDIGFQNGTEFFITAQSLLFYKVPLLKTVRVSLIQLRSNEERARGGELGGNIFEYDLNAYRFEWAHRFGTELQPGRVGIGLSLSYNQSETNVFLPPTTVLQPVITPSGQQIGVAQLNADRSGLAGVNRDTFGARFGWQVALRREENKVWKTLENRSIPSDDRLLWGTVVDYSHYLTKRTTEVPRIDIATASGLVPASAVGPLRAGAAATFPAARVERHTSHSVVTRTGLAWKFRPEKYEFPEADGKETRREKMVRGASWAHLDYQWSWFGDETGELQEHRVHAGVDLALHPAVILSGGVVVDDRQNVSWGAGLKLQAITVDRPACQRVGIDGVIASVSYQHDPLPELGAEFGHGHLWAFAFGLAF